MEDQNIEIQGPETIQHFSKIVPFWNYTDFNKLSCRLLLIAFRVLQACIITENVIAADGYWQATEVAYSMVYGGCTLPWEWQDAFRLRNTIYPFYLAAPLYVLKFLGLDSNMMVRTCPYLAQCVLVCITDSYLWRVGLKTVGAPATRIAFVLYLTNRSANELMARCYTNSVETTLLVIAFYYFLEVKNKFDRNTAIMTALISLAFVIRNTSPVGWIALLPIKIIYEGSFKPLVQAGIFVALPVIAFAILLDTLYYGTDRIAFTFLNFLKVNVFEGIADAYGVDAFHKYLAAYLPECFTVMYPVFLYSLYFYYKSAKKQKRTPYMLYAILSYVIVFSVLSHKERRFLLPILPFSFLLIGYYLSIKIKQKSVQTLIQCLLWAFVIYETLSLIYIFTYVGRIWAASSYLAQKPVAPHSIYGMQTTEVPFYSWAHRWNQSERTQLHFGWKEPRFARLKWGEIIPEHELENDECQLLQELIAKAKSGEMRPEYLILPDPKKDCVNDLEELGIYELEKTWMADQWLDRTGFTVVPVKQSLYHLKSEYQPI